MRLCCLVPYHHLPSLSRQCPPLPSPPPPLVLLPLTPFLLHLLTTRLPLFHLPQFHPSLPPIHPQLQPPPPPPRPHRHRLPRLRGAVVPPPPQPTPTPIPRPHQRQPQQQAPPIPAQCLLNHQPRSMKPPPRESRSPLVCPVRRRCKSPTPRPARTIVYHPDLAVCTC